MPQLRKVNHEAFCIAYVKYRRPRRAAIMAGYARGSASSQAYRLRQRADIQNRIRELEHLTYDEREFLRMRSLRELALYAFGGLSKVLKDSDDGKPKIDISSMTPEDFTGISLTVKVRRSRGGDAKISVRAKMSGKYEALKALLPLCAPEPEFRGPKEIRLIGVEANHVE